MPGNRALIIEGADGGICMPFTDDVLIVIIRNQV